MLTADQFHALPEPDRAAMRDWLVSEGLLDAFAFRVVVGRLALVHGWRGNRGARYLHWMKTPPPNLTHQRQERL